MLVTSNLKWFRYDLIWEKEQGCDFLNANRKPLRKHENILLFSNGKTIYNKQMVKDLESLGITPNKSLTLNFDYSKLSIELFPHFLRGLIDGDGDFNLYHRNNRNHPHIGLIGSKHLIHSTKEMLQKVFPDMSIMTFHAIGCHENIWRLGIYNMKDFKKLLNYIYQDATIFLDRKYENYLRISEEEIFKNCKI